MRDNLTIPSFQDLAKEFNVSIENVGKFQTRMVIDCDSGPIVDIAFTSKSRSVLDGILFNPPKFEIADNIYCYGRCSTALCNDFRADTDLHKNLQLLLDQFKSPVEWSNGRLVTYQSVATAESDSTAGRRFLGAFANIKNRLDCIDTHNVSKQKSDGIGPSKYRGFTKAMMYVYLSVLAVIAISVHFHSTSR